MNSLTQKQDAETRVAIALMMRLARLSLWLDSLSLDVRDQGRVRVEDIETIQYQMAAVEAAARYLAGARIVGDPHELAQELESAGPATSAHAEAEARAMRLAERLAALSPLAAADWLVMLLELVDRASSDSGRLLERVFSALAERLATGRWS